MSNLFPNVNERSIDHPYLTISRDTVICVVSDLMQEYQQDWHNLPADASDSVKFEKYVVTYITHALRAGWSRVVRMGASVVLFADVQLADGRAAPDPVRFVPNVRAVNVADGLDNASEIDVVEAFLENLVDIGAPVQSREEVVEQFFKDYPTRTEQVDVATEYYVNLCKKQGWTQVERFGNEFVVWVDLKVVK